jgi:hypothetical protein
MKAARPSCSIHLLGAAVWLAAAGVSHAAGTPAPSQGTTAPSDEQQPQRPQPDDSEREASIRRAREEIRKDPKQRKFILFRYGLSEEDLR